MKRKKYALHWGLALCLVYFMISCGDTGRGSTETAPLASWNESRAKQNIIEFVQAVSTEGSEEYLAPEERIVCFDNDGTLWTEQPVPNQILFSFDRLKAMAKEDSSLYDNMPYKAILSEDTSALKGLRAEDIVQIVAQVNASTALDSFDAAVQKWFATSKHPRYDRPMKKITYQPMIELLDYLRAHDFHIFIVSGGSVEFMRPISDELYGISRDDVIGSRMKIETVRSGDSLHVERKAQLEWNDDKEGKVTSIEEFIGRKPIMVVGNSDGDLAMMEYAAKQTKKTLMVYLLHNDGEREYDYAQGVLAGSLSEGLEKAKENGWTLINMKTDWARVFTE